ncbi:DUF4382 domain-containing protein [Robertkochia marina]|uniref:DUF4382 domain-containing protein n=1 Tax=Robertkochia marina TaxID=1227945 RepID=A0A4S3M559_9FLAO|nr:DUF4382 domain-containing protein [Robertkochia marina]THD69471.1 DUF4382 domain-containing protein [Robertkochia marina]TRZ47269.1 DUF4382 domain-containing protein [Robertkochia marina]
MLNKFLRNALALFVLTGATVSCSDQDDTKLSDTARLTVRLTDAPGDYDHVYVDVQDVMINPSEDPESGWVSLENVNTGVYDLLKLTGGENVLLADVELPAGKLGQVRLVLGEENSVVIDGEQHALKTPSSQQSGLKILLNETVEAGYTYNIVLDFDVDASVVIAGASGIKSLKPVIHASSVATSGIISGKVEPVGFDVKVSVEGQGISAYTDEGGNFFLYGVPGGTYDLMVAPDPTQGYANAVATGVTVTNGETTVLETILLPELTDGYNVFGKVTKEDMPFAAFTAKLVTGTDENMTEYEAVYSTDGGFTFYNVPVGSYSLEITPDEEGATATTQTVEVAEGEVNYIDLGAIAL